MATRNIINKTSKMTLQLPLISLLMLCINFMHCDRKTDLLVNISNIFLFATLLHIIFLKIFIFNADHVEENEDTDDTLLWTINAIHTKLIIGLIFGGIKLLIPVLTIEYFPLHLVLIVFTFSMVRDLMCIILFNKPFNSSNLIAPISENKYGYSYYVDEIGWMYIQNSISPKEKID